MPQNATSPAEDAVRTQVLVVDDHLLLAETIASALSSDEGFAVDVVTTTGDGLAKIADRGTYDVVLLDYDLPEAKGLTSLRDLISANGGKVVLFSGVAGWAVIQRAVEMGASGYIPKTMHLNSLKNVLRLIAGGEVYLPSEYVRRVSSYGEGGFGLKPREMLVLNLLGEGLQNKEIGQSLGLEDTIVKMVVRSICQKLEVQNRTQAVIAARKNGLI